jgi:hypothetical protein
MGGGLRVPVFLVAVALSAVAVLIDLGTLALPPQARQPGASAVSTICVAPSAPASCSTAAGRSSMTAQAEQTQLTQPPRPGLGVPYLALVDGVVLLVLALMAAAIVVPARIHGRVQGAVGLVASVIVILAAIAMAVRALGQLVLMVALLLAIPFGTLVYLIIWGSFDRTGAAIALSLLMIVKIAMAVCIAIAHESFLKDAGIMVLVAGALIANLVVSILHGAVPLFLVSITDAIAAIVVAIVAIVLAVLCAAGSIVSILRALSPPS